MKIKFVDEPIIARAISFFWFKRIYIGTIPVGNFETYEAVVAHEEGHCELHHTELRILCLLFAPFLFKWICKRQELQADRYAAIRGHAKPLIRLLETEFDGGSFQPSHAVRRQALKLYEQTSRPAPVKGRSLGSA